MSVVVCPHCSAVLPAVNRGVVEQIHCTGCRREVGLCALPALDRPLARAPLAVSAAQGEPACYACPDKKAVAVCQSCGSFTCPTCEVEWFGEHLCLGCVHTLREVKNDVRFRSRGVLHDNRALMLLVLPILFIPFYGVFLATLFSPFALFLVFRHRKDSRGIVPRGPFRLIAAGTLAMLLLLGGVTGVGFLAWSIAEGVSGGEPVDVLPTTVNGGNPATAP